MILIGAGQGLAFAPLTSSGLIGVSAEDAGAASGLVNTFHQIGMSLGLGILVTAAAHAGSSGVSSQDVLAHRVGVALSAGSVLLAVCLAVVLTLIVPSAGPRRHRPKTNRPEDSTPSAGLVSASAK